MKPRPFAYARPDDLDGAIAILEAHGGDAQILAGGQSLMATLNMRLSAPEILVDISRIGGLSEISADSGMLRIGALARHVDVARSPLIAEHAPLIAAAMPEIGHPAIRNRGTFGGSLAFADPAAELPACAVALEATLVIRGGGGERRVAAADFFKGLYETDLAPGEILVAAEISLPDADRRFAFREMSRRHGDFAVIGVAIATEFAGGKFAGTQLVYFGAGDRPVSATASAALVDGDSWTSGLMDRLAESLKAELDPPQDLNASAAMRRHLAGVLTRRALAEIAGEKE